METLHLRNIIFTLGHMKESFVWAENLQKKVTRDGHEIFGESPRLKYAHNDKKWWFVILEESTATKDLVFWTTIPLIQSSTYEVHGYLFILITFGFITIMHWNVKNKKCLHHAKTVVFCHRQLAEPRRVWKSLGFQRWRNVSRNRQRFFWQENVWMHYLYESIDRSYLPALHRRERFPLKFWISDQTIPQRYTCACGHSWACRRNRFFHPPHIGNHEIGRLVFNNFLFNMQKIVFQPGMFVQFIVKMLMNFFQHWLSTDFL